MIFGHECVWGTSHETIFLVAFCTHLMTTVWVSKYYNMYLIWGMLLDLLDLKEKTDLAEFAMCGSTEKPSHIYVCIFMR